MLQTRLASGPRHFEPCGREIATVSVEPDLNFEAALDELEQIVDDLEAGEPRQPRPWPSTSRGIHLLARCQNLLDGPIARLPYSPGSTPMANP